MSDTSAQTVAFVRESMLPEEAPPVTERGAIKWVRENLFSGALNSILTVGSVVLIYFVLSAFLRWTFGGVWEAASLSECRDVLAAYGQSSHSGACWAVIRERWLQYLFGFYPSDLYWRPILAFALMFVALAPVLFSEYLPRRMFWFSAAYPFLAVWLIWGGSFWGPLLVVAGFGVGFLVFRLLAPLAGSTIGAVAGLVTAVIFWGWLSPAISFGLHQMITNARLEQAQATLPQELDAVTEASDSLEASIEAAQADIDAAKAVQDEALAALLAARDEGADRAALAPLEEAFEEARATLTGLRAGQAALLTENAELTRQQSTLSTLVRRVEGLTELEQSLPGLRAEASELRAALPDTVAKLITADNLPSEIPSEDVNALRAALSAENNLSNTEIAVRATYETLGLVGLEPVSSSRMGGFLLAILIGVAGIVLSLPLGILLALGRQSDLLIINVFSTVFIEVIRGVPLIVWLFTASLLLNYFLPPGTNFDLMLRVIIMVTLFASAYIAEVVRGGLAALPKGQYEAADALGLDYARSMRLIVLPQALKISIPGIVNTFIGLFKDTTLVVFVGLLDPLKGLTDAIRADSNWTGLYWEPFIFPAVIFFVFCYAMGRYSIRLEKKLQREHR